MLYPLKFEPVYQPRVWGGRRLEELFQKKLPPGKIGESWEISDWPEAQSIVAEGPLLGRTLHWLVENLGRELMGHCALLNGRFPLLVKLLDARETLSLQVHPPATAACELGGDPKNEMWYIAESETGSELWAGLSPGITRAQFAAKVAEGSAADCCYRLRTRPGDAIYLPSGTVHAIGGGHVIFEVQQNSDTTYRVFDWNRMGLDGKPRSLHIQEALASIDFQAGDPPQLVRGDLSGGPAVLARAPEFEVTLARAYGNEELQVQFEGPLILGGVKGSFAVTSSAHSVRLRAGEFCLLPASLRTARLLANTPAEWLQIRIPPSPANESSGPGTGLS